MNDPQYSHDIEPEVCGCKGGFIINEFNMKEPCPMGCDEGFVYPDHEGRYYDLKEMENTGN